MIASHKVIRGIFICLHFIKNHIKLRHDIFMLIYNHQVQFQTNLVHDNAKNGRENFYKNVLHLSLFFDF